MSITLDHLHHLHKVKSISISITIRKHKQKEHKHKQKHKYKHKHKHKHKTRIVYFYRISNSVIIGKPNAKEETKKRFNLEPWTLNLGLLYCSLFIHSFYSYHTILITIIHPTTNNTFSIIFPTLKPPLFYLFTIYFIYNPLDTFG
uniref:Uncharacterized protein n=1 Tax=Malassezia furfur TaxID=55194 RepID=A0A2I6QC15_MALFU|nr:hypothetical protein [Malassezia furfur]AUN27920.1 hypothetical protein [Malassezia furfur]